MNRFMFHKRKGTVQACSTGGIQRSLHSQDCTFLALLTLAHFSYWAVCVCLISTCHWYASLPQSARHNATSCSPWVGSVAAACLQKTHCPQLNENQLHHMSYAATSCGKLCDRSVLARESPSMYLLSAHRFRAATQHS